MIEITFLASWGAFGGITGEFAGIIALIALLLAFMLKKPAEKAEIAAEESPAQAEYPETDGEPSPSEEADEVLTDGGAESEENITPVSDAPAEEIAAAAAEESPVTYRLAKSFAAKLILSDEIVKERYSEVKNALLSYKKVKARTSWRSETYRCGRKTIAKLIIKGKQIHLYLALSAEDVSDKKYRVEKAGRRKANPVTPLVFRIRNPLRVKHAKALVELLAAKHNLIPLEREKENFAPAYQTEEELLTQSLIRRVKASDSYIKK